MLNQLNKSIITACMLVLETHIVLCWDIQKRLLNSSTYFNMMPT